MSEQAAPRKRNVSHLTIRARKPLASYSSQAKQLLAQWLDVDKDLLDEVMEAIRSGNAYHSYQIPKPGGNEWRTIHEPYGGLKEVQRRILDRLLYPIPLSNAAHGAVPGRSVVTNAQQHLPHAKAMLNLDIRHAFPSVRFRRVHGVFRRYVRPILRGYGPLPPAGQSGLDPIDEAIHLLASMTTFEQQVTHNYQTRQVWCLPQGAPTSGYLLNLSCMALDGKIYKIIEQHPQLSLRYSRYLDDLTISSPVSIPHDVQEAITLAIIKNDFHVNHRKTQSLGPDDDMVVCGVMVSNGTLEADPSLLQRCSEMIEKAVPQKDPRTEQQTRRKLRGVMAFFRQVYGESLPEPIATPYQQYRTERGLPEDNFKETGVPNAPPPSIENIDALSLLAIWLDVEPEILTKARELANSDKGYETWEISKGNGKTRTITSPCDELKDIQQRMLTRLFYHIPVSNAAHGFVPGRSIVTNGLSHLGTQHLLNLDLKDAFPSVTKHRVELGLQIGLGRVIKKFGLRCDRAVRDELIAIMGELVTRNDQLPQGAPTSGYLLNIACQTLDRRLFEVLNKVGGEIVYTRYADDLTFSSREPLPEALLPAVKKAIRRNGFRWNPQKTHQAAVEKGQNIEVCGLRIDGDQLRIPPAKLKIYRSILRRAAKKIPTGGLDLDTRHQIQGIVGFVSMVYGELPRTIAAPYEDFLQQHPSARPTGSSREKIAFYPNVLPG